MFYDTDDEEEEEELVALLVLRQAASRQPDRNRFTRLDRGFLLEKLSDTEFAVQFRMSKEIFVKLDDVRA